MTPLKLVGPDDDGRRDHCESEPARASVPDELYGNPQHEESFQPAEQMEAFYGEAQHESMEECRWGEPFPWLLEADESDRRPPTRSRTEIPLRRLGREQTSTRR